MSEQQLGQHLQEVRVVFNPSYSAGLMALSEEWGISPVAVARRIVREVLRDRGVLDHPRGLPPTETADRGWSTEPSGSLPCKPLSWIPQPFGMG